MPTYRYLASATRGDEGWTIQVEGFPGVVVEADDAKVSESACSHAARHLGVSSEDITIHLNYFHSRENVPWRERCDFWPDGEHSVQRQIFRGGSSLEALDEFRAWLAPYSDDAGQITILATTFNYPNQADGRAPVELDVVYEREGDPVPNAVRLASKVVATLAGRGMTARLTDDSDADTAALVLAAHPELRFVVTQYHDERAWSTERTDDVGTGEFEEIDSTLDGLGVSTPAVEIADAIHGHLRGDPPPELPQGSVKYIDGDESPSIG